jgi:predicted double-glycine peptidase
VTVIGVRKDAVLINDPWFGRAWHAKVQFESAFATFADMAVVLDAP